MVRAAEQRVIGIFLRHQATGNVQAEVDILVPGRSRAEDAMDR